MAKAKRFTHDQTVKLAVGGILTAIVVVFQLFGSSIKLGYFSGAFVLVPIAIGAAICGPLISTWLGFVFGVVVLLSGDAAAFLTVSVPGTIITVLLKGSLCGLFAGLIFQACKKYNIYLAAVLAAIACPVTNTGIFLLGGRIFFYDFISDLAAANGFTNTGLYMIVGLVGINFVFELISSIVLCPAVVRVVRAVKK